MRLKKSLWYFFFPVVSVVLFQACSSNNNPATPASSKEPIIVANLGENGSLNIVTVLVSDSTGTTGTANTSVTLVDNSNSIPLTLLGIIPTGAITQSGAPNITGGLYTNSVTYTAGDTYTFNVDIGGKIYTSSVTAIAGNPLLQPSSGTAGVTCSWAAGVGNYNYVEVANGSAQPMTIIGPPIPTNPYVLANSVFSGNETPGSGNDVVNFHVVQLNKGAFPGCQSSSCVLMNNVASVNY